MLTEVHALGIPWKGWEYPDYLLGSTAAVLRRWPRLRRPARATTPPTSTTSGTPRATSAPRTRRSGERVRAELAEMGDTIGHRWNIANRFYYRYQLPASRRDGSGSTSSATRTARRSIRSAP